ncbi:hypothetical protein [uncultured Flavobacterium sp.]|uniref:hypothetical protein n=1 Tax=uncultured Flavobacterium sp. TaxID=165435 RepID=UPI0030CA5824
MFNKIKILIKKLSLDVLKERAEATASTELLASISGGVNNDRRDRIEEHCEEGLGPCETKTVYIKQVVATCFII